MNTFIIKIFKLIYYMVFVPSYFYFCVFYFDILDINNFFIFLFNILMAFFYCILLYFIMFYLLKVAGVIDDN